MLIIQATEAWRTVHAGAAIGLLELSGVANEKASPPLNERKRQIEAQIRADYRGFSRQDFLSLPVIAAYKQYYQGFKKTYHVLLQVESIALIGKKLPNISPLVDSNFIAEVETFVLTAGHDVDKLQTPLWMDVSHEGDQITQMSGEMKSIRAGDMLMRDASGVSCSIIYGQDNRSAISAATTHVLYVAYAPSGVPADTVQTQLEKIEENIRMFSPNAIVEQLRLIVA
ncbi:MAG: hypothetical protein HN413_01885 [Chloroflexi bacterium]|jgi:DNA/RNA-binding domain of Phe-tRNA-synthetase-like protein|nr:hypothetical protein [Chloroflexota bacterium]